jgi:hypothetical protein
MIWKGLGRSLPTSEVLFENLPGGTEENKKISVRIAFL